ncbi:MAG: RagB/SusD family nutrient uptake outer membrane protein, partial [Tannerella sp.]|nr:RagB/SusD family nutrient uptake outer membrane protein [Tannerella sp.]
MKNIKIFLSVIIAISFSACNDEFMEQIPQTNLTVEGFFKSTNDLQSYVYGLYRDNALYPERPPYDDFSSDNVAVKTDHELFQSILTGLRTPQNASGWDGWGSLRSVNVMLTNLANVTGTEADINHYVGIARYMRAWFYIQKVQTYSDVPWIDRPLSTDDEA